MFKSSTAGPLNSMLLVPLFIFAVGVHGIAAHGIFACVNTAALIQEEEMEPPATEAEAGQESGTELQQDSDPDPEMEADPQIDPEQQGEQQQQSEPGQDEQEPDLGPNGYEMSDMDLIIRVEQLVEQMKSAKMSDRDDAETMLLHLGPPVLDSLAIPDTLSTEVRERLLQISAKLEKEAAVAVTRASRVTLSGNMNLEEIFEEILKQTDNDVGLVGAIPVDLVDTKMDVEFEDAPFWDVLNVICRQSGLMIDVYGCEAGKLRLKPVVEQDGAAGAGAAAVAPQAAGVPYASSGVFEVAVTRVESARNLLQPQLNYLSVGIVVHWEPRIRPISVDLPGTAIEALSEFGEEIKVTNRDVVFSGIVQQDFPELEFRIPMELVDRQVETIDSLSATINAVLPGKLETFTLDRPGDLEIGDKTTQAGASVTWGGIHKNEDLFSVTLDISFDTLEQGLESYQGWVLDNEMYMLDGDGKRHDYIGLENHHVGNGKIGVRYLFPDDPSEWSLVYKTPGAVVKVPVRIVIKNIPLP